MTLVKEIEIRPLASVKGGMTKFYTPQSSHETMLVQIPPDALLRHNPANEWDYQPKKRLFPYDIAAAASVLTSLD